MLTCFLLRERTDLTGVSLDRTRLHGRPQIAHAREFFIKPRDANHCRQLRVSISCSSNSAKLNGVTGICRTGK